MKKYYVNILKSLIAEKSYVGFTENLKRRIKEHNSGKSHFTKKYKPWELVYTEEFDDKTTAIRREKYFRSSVGRRKIKVIFNAPVAQKDRAAVS